MKKLNIILSSLTLAAVAGFFFSSCTSTTAPGTTIGAPTNLMALSKSSTSISIEWVRASGDTAVDTVIFSDGTGASYATATSTTATSYTINGLSTNTVYTIWVGSAGARSSSIQWMTAVRTTGLKIYQFSSLNQSGLQLNVPGGQAAVVSAVKANAGTMDFFLDDFQNNDSILSASQIAFEGSEFLDGNGPTWRNSFFDKHAMYIPGGIDDYYSASDFTNQIDSVNNPNLQGNEFDLPNDAVYATKGSAILLAETQDGNFAKIEIVPDAATGMLYSGSGTDKYITVNVSYQPTAGKPYAARGHQAFSGRPTRIPVR